MASGVVFWLLATLSLNIYEQGTRLPDITLRNAAGETIQLSDYQGGPLVINLWATWCRRAGARCQCWKMRNNNART